MDLGGLACLALGVYLGYVVYLGWNGGTVGNGAEQGLAYVVGLGAVLAPVAIFLCGLGLILRPLLPSPAAIAAGMAAIIAGLLLALAAQTAGLGPETPIRKELFDPGFFSDHGGIVGETLYWGATTLFQRIGAHILAVLLVLAGALLVWGRSLSDLISAASRGYRRARDGAGEFATAVRQTGNFDPDPDLVETDPIDTERLYGPPEPIAEDPVISRIAPGDAESPDSEGNAPGVANFDDGVRVDEEDAEEEPTVAEVVPIEPGSRRVLGDEKVDEGAQPGTDVTPMGLKRSAVTESEEIDYEAPSADLLEKGKVEKAPDHKDRDAVARTLLEALGHFGVEAKLVGVVSGPHVSRYELRLAPGTKVAKISQLKDDLAYALASTDIRILAPIPGKQAVGVEVPNQRRRLVRLGDIYGGRPQGASPLVAWLGKDIAGHAVWTDLSEDAPRARRGHDRIGQVRVGERDPLLDPAARLAERGPPGARRPEAGRTEPLRARSPSPHAGRHLAAARGERAQQPDLRDGEPLRRHERGAGAKPRRAQPGAAGGRRAAAPHILCVIDELADLMMVAPAEVEDASSASPRSRARSGSTSCSPPSAPRRTSSPERSRSTSRRGSRSRSPRRSTPG